MTLSSLSYGRTINVGNYESVRIEATVELDAVDRMEPFHEQQRRLVTAAKAVVAEEEVAILQQYPRKK